MNIKKYLGKHVRAFATAGMITAAVSGCVPVDNEPISERGEIIMSVEGNEIPTSIREKLPYNTQNNQHLLMKSDDACFHFSTCYKHREDWKDLRGNDKVTVLGNYGGDCEDEAIFISLLKDKSLDYDSLCPDGVTDITYVSELWKARK